MARVRRLAAAMTAVGALAGVITQAGRLGTVTVCCVAGFLVVCALAAAWAAIVWFRSRPEVIQATTFRKWLDKAESAEERERVLRLQTADKALTALKGGSVAPIVQQVLGQSGGVEGIRPVPGAGKPAA